MGDLLLLSFQREKRLQQHKKNLHSLRKEQKGGGSEF
jgi:hypothetical protein